MWIRQQQQQQQQHKSFKWKWKWMRFKWIVFVLFVGCLLWLITIQMYLFILGNNATTATTTKQQQQQQQSQNERQSSTETLETTTTTIGRRTINIDNSNTEKHSNSNKNWYETNRNNNKHVFLDTDRPSWYRPLRNDYLLGNYNQSELSNIIPWSYEHNNINNNINNQTINAMMDVVIIASTIDATLAIAIHNLYHLCGFRRFIFIFNNATKDCPNVFDLIPQQHYNQNHQNQNIQQQPYYKPNVCLDHYAFYQTSQTTSTSTILNNKDNNNILIDKILENPSNFFPNIYRGAPQKNKRGNQYVHVSRFGWYLQQFSKYLISQSTTITTIIPDLSQQYLTIDGDIIMTRPMEFSIIVNDQQNQNDQYQQQQQQQSLQRKFIMPQTSKNPKQWDYFVNLILGENNNHINDTTINNDINEEELMIQKKNYVVGWMVLDRSAVSDLIDLINKRLQPASFENENDIDTTTTAAATTQPYYFPWNVLQHAESTMNDSLWFSEFYLYARFVLQSSSKYKQLYSIQSFPEPTRNKGGFKYTCHLTKQVYDLELLSSSSSSSSLQQQQNNNKRPPWMIWEEHKQHTYDACTLDGYNGNADQLTKLWNVGIWHEFHKPPWGGGNQFLLALRYGLQNYWNMTVHVKSDEDATMTTTTATSSLPVLLSSKEVLKQSQVLLANSITFKGGMDGMKELLQQHNLALVHRVDGPYYVARYFQSLNFTSLLSSSSSSSPQPKLPQEDKKTKSINDQFACATIFQSTWSLHANEQLFSFFNDNSNNISNPFRNPVIIPNTVDSTIFYPKSSSKSFLFATTDNPQQQQQQSSSSLSLNRRSLSAQQQQQQDDNNNNNDSNNEAQQQAQKIRIVATCHSDNVRKGFDTIMWLDEHLDFERFEFYYMGGYPKPSRKEQRKNNNNNMTENDNFWFQPKNIQLFPGTDSWGVAEFLRNHGDIYLAPARYEPASNAVLEALACGLPVLYQKGSSHGDLVQKGGLGYTSTEDILIVLEQLLQNYENHVNAISIPSIQDISRQYLAIMRWCFYMKHVFL